MPQHRIRRAVAACSFLGLLALAAAGRAMAADADSPLKGSSPAQRRVPHADVSESDASIWERDGGEFIPSHHHGCRLIPQPQLNMWGEAAFYRPSWVCMSRGLYADTFPPPPPRPRGFFGLW
jgi:hypothetical protein